jgi:hypothetical protein
MGAPGFTVWKRARMVICHADHDVVLREADEIRGHMIKLGNLGLDAPADKKDALMHQYKGGNIKARLSYYFAIEALRVPENEWALAEEYTRLAEECARDELDQYWQQKTTLSRKGKAGGQASSHMRTKQKEERNKNIINYATKLLESGTEPRNLASKLARNAVSDKLSTRQIRNILKNAVFL